MAVTKVWPNSSASPYLVILMILTSGPRVISLTVVHVDAARAEAGRNDGVIHRTRDRLHQGIVTWVLGMKLGGGLVAAADHEVSVQDFVSDVGTQLLPDRLSEGGCVMVLTTSNSGLSFGSLTFKPAAMVDAKPPVLSMMASFTV